MMRWWHKWHLCGLFVKRSCHLKYRLFFSLSNPSLYFAFDIPGFRDLLWDPSIFLLDLFQPIERKSKLNCLAGYSTLSTEPQLSQRKAAFLIGIRLLLIIVLITESYRQSIVRNQCSRHYPVLYKRQLVVQYKVS